MDLRAAIATAATALVALPVHAEGLIDSLVRRFSESEFELLRTESNAPFFPLAWLSATSYQDAEFTRPDGTASDVNFHQSQLSQGAFLPLPLGIRDALVVGEWIGVTRFDLESGLEDFDVLSVSVPIGWARQSSPDWQIGAFLSPLGHKTDRDSWYWETLGGVFWRYTSGDRLAWLFGAYFDVAPLEDFYTPYLGATWVLNEHWTIMAVMPWPGVSYAPTTETVFRLGVSPSGTSWSIERGERRPRMTLTAWNFGLAVEHRVVANIWLGMEVGVSGIRGLSLSGNDFQGLETRLDHTGFALLSINFRPPPMPARAGDPR